MRKRSILRLGIPPIVFTHEWENGACDCGGPPPRPALPGPPSQLGQPGQPVIDVMSTVAPRPLPLRPVAPAPVPMACACGCGTLLLDPGVTQIPVGWPLCTCGCGRPLASPPPQPALPPAGGTGYGPIVY